MSTSNVSASCKGTFLFWCHKIFCYHLFFIIIESLLLAFLVKDNCTEQWYGEVIKTINDKLLCPCASAMWTLILTDPQARMRKQPEMISAINSVASEWCYISWNKIWIDNVRWSFIIKTLQWLCDMSELLYARNNYWMLQLKHRSWKAALFSYYGYHCNWMLNIFSRKK